MQVSVESVGTLERRMSFSLPAERLDTHVGGRMRELARTVRIKGFRPGRVPAGARGEARRVALLANEVPHLLLAGGRG